jgi:NAD(P)-dependent dehydrogenase (short-subunit alcohol dehydrogenase family)
MNMVAVVTGGSRGAGKGIAIALGQSGATVYVTGRSQMPVDSPYGGTVAETAALVSEAAARASRSASIIPMTRPWQSCSLG